MANHKETSTFASKMIKIESHIENLLLRHDCVIVPGIGGFVTHYEDSIISENGQEIYPPYRSISFISQLKTNDGLLAQSYMTTYDTSYPKAQSLVEENTRHIREQLHETGEYMFGNLGKLQLTQNQALIFTPASESGIFSKELYGLDLCPITTQAQDAELQKPITTTVSATVATSQKPETATHANTMASTDTVAHDAANTHYIIRISKNAVRHAVATIAAALLYFAFTIAPSVNPIDHLQEAGIFSTKHTQEHKTPANHTIAPAQKTTASTDTLSQVATASETSAATVDTVRQTTYTIVLASAISEKGAQALIQSLDKEGLRGAQFIHDGKMNRVIYASYPSQEEACKALRNLRLYNDKFSSAWAMKR